MKSNVTEIAPAVYRISTFHPEFGIQFNQFLIADDEPFLMHTGFRQMFPVTREGVATVLDPATVRTKKDNQHRMKTSLRLLRFFVVVPIFCGLI